VELDGAYGKTTVALELCEVLPDSVYVKCGHNKIRSDKPGKFFDNLTDLYSFIVPTPLYLPGRKPFLPR